MPFKSPVTRDQYDKLKQDQRKLVDIQETIRRAEACGVDCSGQKGMSEHLRATLENLEKQFFNPPPK